MKIGRGIAAGILGMLFMLFVATDFVLFGVVPLNSVLVTILPGVGLVLGVVLGILAGNRKERLLAATAMTTTPTTSQEFPPPNASDIVAP